jgi:hypothetical protein
VPRPALRVVRALVSPVSPVARRIIDLALYTDAGGTRVDSTDTLKRFPIRRTSLEEFVRRRWEAGTYRES